MNPTVMKRLAAFEPVWAPRDPAAQQQLLNRIEGKARDGQLVTYSELVAGIPFNVFPDRPNYTIDVASWQDLDRALIRDFLGALSLDSYRNHCFLVSALVVRKDTGVPSPAFLQWVADAYRIEEVAATVTWGQHRDRALSYYRQDGSFTEACAECPV